MTAAEGLLGADFSRVASKRGHGEKRAELNLRGEESKAVYG
ncbi:MAG: hypothetical protein ACJAZN_002149 [Planctomycetota bacterium]|jgi:hypothetical protein